jgi:hypothetical protein
VGVVSPVAPAYHAQAAGGELSREDGWIGALPLLRRETGGVEDGWFVRLGPVQDGAARAPTDSLHVHQRSAGGVSTLPPLVHMDGQRGVDPSAATAEQGSPAVLSLWPADQQGIAACVAQRESTWRPDAVNGNHRGLYQINIVVHAERIARLGYTEADMLEAYPNAVVAHDLWAEQGWDGPWRAQRGYCW